MQPESSGIYTKNLLIGIRKGLVIVLEDGEVGQDIEEKEALDKQNLLNLLEDRYLEYLQAIIRYLTTLENPKGLD